MTWQEQVRAVFDDMQSHAPADVRAALADWLQRLKESGAPETVLPMLTEGVLTYSATA